MTENPKSSAPEAEQSILTTIILFIRRLRLEFQARLSNNPYLNHPFGGGLSAEAVERIKRLEDEAKIELSKINN